MKKLLLAVLLSPVIMFSSASAATPTILTPVSTPSQPNLVITAFGGGLPDFIEIYNQASEPVSLSGKTLQVSVSGSDAATMPQSETYSIALPDAWLLPKQYFMLQRGVGSEPNISYYQLPTSLSSVKLTQILFDSTVIIPIVNSSSVPRPMEQNEWAQHKQRGNATLKMTGLFTTDYKLISIVYDIDDKDKDNDRDEILSGTPTGSADTLYVPADSSSGLQILEVLSNARACSPTETAYDCSDYVKLYNPTNIPISLDLYRVRSDSGGVKSSTSNTFALGGVLQPSEYALVRLKDSGEPISLTNTGGYVWLEDAWGVKIYGDPVLYPDASADSKKGQSWAVDDLDVWQWMLPAPAGPNYWPPVVPSAPVAATPISTSLSPCKAGQERSPETNRCRNIISVATGLTPCKPGQERNSETNRCRSVLAATTTLTPCKAGETRNPDTNRCRKNTSTASTATPCKSGYERNPETNRCRKVQSAVNTASINDVKTSQLTNKRAWWLAGAIILAALTYAIYEWRQDIWLRLPFKR